MTVWLVAMAAGVGCQADKAAMCVRGVRSRAYPRRALTGCGDGIAALRYAMTIGWLGVRVGVGAWLVGAGDEIAALRSQ